MDTRRRTLRRSRGECAIGHVAGLFVAWLCTAERHLVVDCIQIYSAFSLFASHMSFHAPHLGGGSCL